MTSITLHMHLGDDAGTGGKAGLWPTDSFTDLQCVVEPTTCPRGDIAPPSDSTSYSSPNDCDHTMTVWTISLDKFLESGALSDVYSATCTDGGGRPVPLVAKVVNLSEAADPIDAEQAVRNEATLYATRLRHLQGCAVPRFHGLFKGAIAGARRPVLVTLLEDAGECMADVFGETYTQVGVYA